MKESEFIEQNKEKWMEFENNLRKNDADPSKTSKLFIQMTDDLSYARTFYKNRSVKLYLNGTAKLLFNDLNTSQKKGSAAFFNFWKKELPLTVYRSRRAMLISLFVFIGCFILGVVTSIQDKEFAATILSKDYVNMTNENIAKGDAMAVYKKDNELNTFLPILYNNLKVDFLTFFSGIFMAIGSLVIMVFNGVMVGVFQYFFIERGLFWESFLGIWTHGSLEIPAIILSGGAGLTLGKGLLFPGTHSRFQAFKLSGMDGLKLIMGVAPVTLIAAFIEGFLTRHTDIPDPLRFIFILISFSVILMYFFIYPRRVAKKYKDEPREPEHAFVYKAPVPFNPAEIYPNAKIMTETFRFFFNHFVFFGRFLFLIPLVCAILIAGNPFELFRVYDYFIFAIRDFFNYNAFPARGILMLFALAGSSFVFLAYIKGKLKPEPDETFFIKAAELARTGLAVFLLAGIYVLTIYTDIEFTLTIALFLFPFFVFVSCVSLFESLSFAGSFSRALALLKHSWAKFFITAFVFWVVSLIIYLTSMYGLKLLLIQDALVWMLTDDEMTAQKISLGFLVFQSFLSFMLYVILSVISGSFLFFSLKEITTAEHLIKKIKAIAIHK